MASLTNLKSQVSSVLKQLDLPVSIYAATGQDKYRKPRIGMWEEVLEDHDLRAAGAVDMANSFYIGDAAGREKTDNRRKDHATSDRYLSRLLSGPDGILTIDRDLAANIGVRFQTPEEFFLNAATEPYEHVFDPSQYLNPAKSDVANVAVSAPFTKNSPQELVLFCGSPGAGKSTFYVSCIDRRRPLPTSA